VAEPNGAEYLHLVSTGNTGDKIFISNREKQNRSTEITFNRPIEGQLSLKMKTDNYSLKRP
jgi:hypothetical protein